MVGSAKMEFLGSCVDFGLFLFLIFFWVLSFWVWGWVFGFCFYSEGGVGCSGAGVVSVGVGSGYWGGILGSVFFWVGFDLLLGCEFLGLGVGSVSGWCSWWVLGSNVVLVMEVLMVVELEEVAEMKKVVS